MTSNILYSKSKFHLIRDYPEDDPDYCESGDCMLCDLTCTERKKNYDQAVAKSLASAIKFVESAEVEMKKLCYQVSADHGGILPEHWTPTEGELFTVEGIEVEVEYQYEDNIDSGWTVISKENFDFLYQFKPSRNDIRQAVRLKAKPVKHNNIIKDLATPPEEHVFMATITSTGRNVWQYWYTDKNDLNQHSEYFDDRQDALTHYKNRLGIKDSAPPEPKGEESQWELIDEVIDIVRETSGHCRNQLKTKFHLTRRIDTLKENIF